MEPASLSDQHLVERVRAGETSLFEILMRRHNQRLFRVIRSVLRDSSEAEDAMQQAYLSAFSHLHQFAGDAMFTTWLTRIALNEAYARAKRMQRRAEVSIEEGRTMSTESPEARASDRELTRLLEEAIDELPEIYRTVVVMREVEQMSTAETAVCLALSEEAVKVRLHRAKALLRATLCERMESSAAETFQFLGDRCDRVVYAVLARIAR